MESFLSVNQSTGWLTSLIFYYLTDEDVEVQRYNWLYLFKNMKCFFFICLKYEVFIIEIKK